MIHDCINTTCACPLCAVPAPHSAMQVGAMNYRHCDHCDLVFQEPAQRLERDAEFAHYQTHENDVHDPRYRKFLSQLAYPLMELLHAGDEGLDYGAGPGPALAAMLTEVGYPTAVYDPLFAPNEDVLKRQYDFVTATEVIEHMYHPLEEFRRLDSLLKPGGVLGLMTELRSALESFATWYYHRDPTHVCFYSPLTIRWIARRFSWSIERLDTRVIIVRKPANLP